MLQSVRRMLAAGGRDRLKRHDTYVRRYGCSSGAILSVGSHRLLGHGRLTLGRVLAANQLLYRAPLATRLGSMPRRSRSTRSTPWTVRRDQAWSAKS